MWVQVALDDTGTGYGRPRVQILTLQSSWVPVLSFGSGVKNTLYPRRVGPVDSRVLIAWYRIKGLYYNVVPRANKGELQIIN